MEINKKTLKNLFIIVASAIVLYWLLHETERVRVVLNVLKGIFAPFVMGACLAFVLNVPMRAIEDLLQKMQKKATPIRKRKIYSLMMKMLHQPPTVKYFFFRKHSAFSIFFFTCII